MAFIYQTIFVFLVCFVKNNVWAAECTPDQLLACVSGFQNLGAAMEGDEPDVSALCGILTPMITCIENLKNKCEVTAEQQGQIDTILKNENMKTAQSLCKGTDGAGGGCSLMGLQKCVGTNMQDMQNMNPKEACNAKECLSKLLPTCEGEMKTQIQSTVDGLSAMCSAANCPMEAVKACMDGFDKDDQDHSNMCRKTKDAAMCLTKLKNKCEGEMKKSIEESLENMKFALEPQCCESIDTIRDECSKQMVTEGFKAEPKQCMNVESAYTCVMTVKTDCTGVLKEGIDDTKDGLKKQLESCQNGGYNITISLQTGKKLKDNSGHAFQPAIAILFAGVMGFVAFWF